MEEDEELKDKKENQFQLDDFNSKSSEKGDIVNDNPKIASPSVIDAGEKLHNKKLSNTSDKLNQVEDMNSHKNGTIAGSDHKPFAKYSKKRILDKIDDPPIDNSRAEVHEDKENDQESNAPGSNNEIIYKERKSCPKCPPRVIAFINKILENNVYIIFMTIVTIFALFGDDFRLLFSPKSGDEVFWSLT